MTTGLQYMDSDEDEVVKEKERKSDGSTKRKIPKLFRRIFYRDNKKFDFLHKKAKEPLSRTSSLQNSLFDLDTQVKINQNILDLQKRTGLNMVQKNGQRKLGPPADWTGPPPGPGCEVFIGRIPRNIYEDIIYPIFNSVGKIYEIRLMMNFSGTNRGFCFIMYTKPEYAQRAIKELNDYEIYPDWRIGVVASVNNCRLHITDLSLNTNVQKLIAKIWPLCEDIEKVSVYTNASNPKEKYALISFRTHRSAAMARRRLLPEQNNFIDKTDVRIEWAHPKMLISDVIEECGYFDENGKIIITSKQLRNEKKNVNVTVKKRVAQNFFKPSKTRTVKNVQAVNQVQIVSEQTFTDRLVNNNNELCNRNQRLCKLDLCNKNSYIGQFENSNIQQINVKQNVYKQHNNSVVDNSMENCNQFKYSIKSDESLSDFSKSSDIDDSRNYSHNPICTSTPCPKVRPPSINPSNCSVVRIPWGYYPANQLPNLYHNNITFHTIRFPWHLMKVTSPNSYNAPCNVRPLQNHLITNCAIPNSNVEHFKSYHGVNRNSRPILNRKT